MTEPIEVKRGSITLFEFLTDKPVDVARSLYQEKLEQVRRTGTRFLVDNHGNVTAWTGKQLERKPRYKDLEEKLSERDAEIERLKARLRRMA